MEISNYTFQSISSLGLPITLTFLEQSYIESFELIKMEETKWKEKDSMAETAAITMHLVRCIKQSAATVARKLKFLLYRILKGRYTAGIATRNTNHAGISNPAITFLKKRIFRLTGFPLNLFFHLILVALFRVQQKTFISLYRRALFSQEPQQYQLMHNLLQGDFPPSEYTLPYDQHQ